MPDFLHAYNIPKMTDVESQAYDFVIMDNGEKLSISEDRRKLISEQYCSMEDTFYVKP